MMTPYRNRLHGRSALLVKIDGEPVDGRRHERKYSPAEGTSVILRRVGGNPDPAAGSMPHVEGHNLTMRMRIPRFTRLTDTLGTKQEKTAHALAPRRARHFCRVYRSLGVSPAISSRDMPGKAMSYDSANFVMEKEQVQGCVMPAVVQTLRASFIRRPNENAPPLERVHPDDRQRRR